MTNPWTRLGTVGALLLLSAGLSETVLSTYHYTIALSLSGAAAVDARLVRFEIDYTMPAYENTY